ncbi:hypothetical protein GH714_009331 [Hevea brasiliensis]|uniref:Retrotransposon gag domain-containing protein n=1 Tax=Hevea brasiliensis TaxID=3981 RepID=A0A6A6LFD1_HEVBR|nr:hypothetical protein GH714_009331 [Hevea brasiliensis]
MTTTPTLAMPNFNEPFIIESDASSDGIGAVLTEHGRPIAFMSRALGVAKKSWSVYAKEMLAIVHPVHTWRPYLLGRKFYIHTDQCSLKHLLEQRIVTPEQQKWVAKLIGHEYEIRVVLPPQSPIIHQLLKEFHDSPIGGHSGVLCTYKRLAQQFYWPSMHRSVKDHVASCEVCQRTKGQVSLLMKAVSNMNGGAFEMGKAKIPEPKSFVGKLKIVPMYLANDAKLWWRTKVEQSISGQCSIVTWDDFKKALKAQFYPENVAYNVQCKLAELQHTGSIREYVRSFTALMLDIKDMSEADRLFNFQKGLKPWARNELVRRGVKELSTALAAVESLDDYTSNASKRMFNSPQVQIIAQTNGVEIRMGEWIGATPPLEGLRGELRTRGLTPTNL